MKTRKSRLSLRHIVAPINSLYGLRKSQSIYLIIQTFDYIQLTVVICRILIYMNDRKMDVRNQYSLHRFTYIFVIFGEDIIN